MQRRNFLKSTGVVSGTVLASSVPTGIGSVAASSDAELFANLRFTVYTDEDGNYKTWGGSDAPVLVGTKTAETYNDGTLWNPSDNKSPSWAPSWTDDIYNGGPLHYIPTIVEMHTEHPNYTDDVYFNISGDLDGDRQIIGAYDPHDAINSQSDFFRSPFGASYNPSDLEDASGRRKRFYLIVEGNDSGLYPFPTGVTIGSIDFNVQFGSDSSWYDQYGKSHTTSMNWSIAQDASRMNVEDNLLKPAREILREIPATVIGMQARTVRTAAAISNQLRVSSTAKKSIKYMRKSDGYLESAVNTLADESNKTEGSFLFTDVDNRLYNDPQSIGDIGTGGPSLHFQA